MVRKKQIVSFCLLTLILSGIVLLRRHSSDYLFVEKNTVLCENSGWYATCRCHGDGKCYFGSPISFRPVCAKIIMETGQIYSCEDGNINCKNNT